MERNQEKRRVMMCFYVRHDQAFIQSAVLNG